jgi:hypothetical protein
MLAVLSTAVAVPAGSNETLQFTAPSGSTLNGGTVDVGMYADGHGYTASGTAVLYTPNYAYDGSDVVFQCAWGLTPCSNGTNDFAGTIALPESRGGSLYLSAGCGGASNAFCGEGGSNGAWSLVKLWWANLLLLNNSTPTASGVGGTVLSAGARGQRELTLTASDPAGPGVYKLTVQIDSKTLYTGTPDNNSGKCVPVGTSGGVLMFDYGQPCRASEAVDIPVETATVQDGQHTLKVSAQDAAGNSAVVYDTTITTLNAPQQSSPPTFTGQSTVGSLLTAQPGTWSAPSGAGKITYTYQWQDCDAHGEDCQAITGAQGSTYTLAPSDLGHTVRALLTASDNDGSSSQATTTSDVVQSPQESLGASPGPGTGSSSPGNTGTGGGVSGSGGGSSGSGPSPGNGGSGGGAGSLGQPLTSPIAVGVANGSGASESAQLALGVKRSLTVDYRRRAFKLTGRLSTSGRPIGGATLAIIAQTAGGTGSRTIARAHTRADGTFSLVVPAGPSRTVTVAYRAFSGDAGYAAQARVKETVRAGAQLQISPRQISSEGEIALGGRVDGPLPHHGVIVDLIVHYKGHWVPIRSKPGGPIVQTDATGHFLVSYKFQGATGRFPFRAEIPGGQAGLPYARGYSNTINVKAN